MIDSHFVIIGALLQVIGTASYLIDTLKGKAKPNRVTWFLWAVSPFIALSAELKHGVGLIALMTFMVGFMPLLIFIASFANRKAYWKLSQLDIVCGLLSVGGLILWQLTGSGNVAILFSLLADVLAWIPTFVKSLKEPESENWHFFLFDAASAGIALLAIDKWNFAHWGWPLWVFSSCLILVLVIRFRLGITLGKVTRNTA